MAESYSVTAVLSAQDKNFSSVFGSAQGAADGLASKLKTGLGFGVMQAIGMKAVNAVTGSLGGLVSGVTQTGKSFETATSQIAATMGKSKDEITNIIGEAERLGATTKFTATEAAEGFNILAMSGLKAEEQIATIGDVLNLAAAGAESMDASAQQVVGTMKGFSMELDGVTDGINNSQYVADLLAKGATLAATDVNALGVALSTVSSNAAQYGQGIQSTEVALLRLAEQNLTGSEAATALSMAMKNIYAPTDKAAETLARLGISAYDSSGKARDFNTVVDELNAALHEQHGTNEELINQDINQIFDARSARVFGKMIVSNSDKVNEFSDGLKRASDGIGSAAEQAATQLDNLEGDMTLFSSATDGLNNAIYKNMNVPMRAFYKIATTAVSKATELVQGLGDKLSTGIDLKELQKALDEKGLAGAAEVLAKSLDGIIPGLKGVAAAAGAIGSVSLINSVLDSKLWKTGVAGIGTFRDVAQSMPGALIRDFGNLKNSVVNFMPPGIVSKVGGALGKIGSDMKLMGYIAKMTGSQLWENFTSDSVLGKAVGKVTGFAGKVGGALGKVGGVVLNTGGQLASGLQTMMGIALKALMPAAMIGAALAGLGLLQEKFGDQINSILAMVQEKGPQVISNFANGIASRVPELISQGATLVSNLLNTIGSLAPSMVGAGVQIITSLVGGVAQSAPQLITSAVTAVGGFASSIISSIPSLIVSGMQLLLGVAQGISANLPRMAQGAVQAVQSFAQNLVANFPAILSTAGQIVTTLVSGITSALPALASGAVSIIGTLVTGFIQNLPQIIQTGVQVIASLAIGIVQGIATLISMIPSLFGTVVNTIMTTDWISVGGQIIEAIGNGITGAIGGLGEKVSGFFSGIGDWFSGGEKAGTDYVTGATTSITASAPQVTGAAQQVATDVSANTVDFFTNSGTAGGQGLMTGFSTGVLDNMGTMTNSVTNMMQSTSDMLNDSSVQSDADSAGQDIVQSAASGIDAGASAAESAIQGTMTSAISALSTSATEAQTAGQDIGTAVVDGFTVAMEPLADAAQQAVSNAVTAMQSGLSAMQSAGQQAGARFAQGIRTGLTQAATAAKTSVKTITSALKSSVSPAQAAGRSAGTRFATGIKSGQSASRGAGTTIGRASVNGMKSNASSARSAGSSLGSKFASGVSSKSGSARSAGSSLAHAAKSGMSGVSTSSIGSHMGQGLVNGLNSKYGAVASAARRLANMAAEAMRKAAEVRSPSRVTKKIGGYIGEGLRLGIASRTNATQRTASAYISDVLQSIRDEAGIHSPSTVMYAIAGQLCKGMDKGITAGAKKSKKIGAIYSEEVLWGAHYFLKRSLNEISKWGTAAATNVKNAAEKMKKAFGPGIKTTGAAIANAFSSAMKTKMKNVSDSATGIISSATDKMVNDAKKQQERFQKAYDYNTKLQKEYEKKAKDKKASSAEKKAAEKKAKEYAALAKKYKASADKFKNLAISYTKAGSAVKTAFTTAFNNQVNAAITSTTNAINQLAQNYQAQYDAIIKARTDFRDKMREITLGEYDDEKKAVTALTDYNVAKRQVEQYGTNLEKLKKILPAGMMNEILAMDTEEGLAYTEKLLSKGTDWLKEYAKSYNSFMSATTSVSNKYYQSQIDELKTKYTKAVEAEFKKLQTSLKTIGQQVMQGFADGMKSKKTALDNAGKTLADSLIKTLKTRLKIHSPSKVAASLGSYTGQGFVNGVEDQVSAARDAMQKLVEMPRPQLAMAAGAENLRLHDEYNYTSNRSYRFEAVTELDGREIARSTAEYTEDELERRRRNSERIKGRR